MGLASSWPLLPIAGEAMVRLASPMALKPCPDLSEAR